MALTPEIKAVVSVIFPRLCPSLPTTNQASESSARRTVQPSSCAVFICSRLSITRCFTGLGRSSLFLDGFRKMALNEFRFVGGSQFFQRGLRGTGLQAGGRQRGHIHKSYKNPTE